MIYLSYAYESVYNYLMGGYTVMNNKYQSKEQINETLVGEVIKYKIKKNGSCGLKLIFKTIAGEYYKDEFIETFDGSLLNTCSSLLRTSSGSLIGVDGIYNSEDNTFINKKTLLFKSGVVAANLEYIDNLDYKNKDLASDVKLCILSHIINSHNAKELLEPETFIHMIDTIKTLIDLENKTDFKNTLLTLEFISNNIEYYISNDMQLLKTKSLSNKGRISPSLALIKLDELVTKYEKMNNNDLIMSIYRVIKSVKSLDSRIA